MAVDRNIVEDCIKGKRRAQNKLYKQYASGMLGVCLRYSRNLHEAEDILQDGFIKVFRNIGNLRNIEYLSGWIKMIMINTAITHLNKNKIRFDQIDENNAGIEEDDSDYTVEQVDPELLLMLIQQLPEGYRIVLNLYVFEELKHKEIAEKLQISVNTSKSQLSKARKFLKNKLEEYNKVNKVSYRYEQQV